MLVLYAQEHAPLTRRPDMSDRAMPHLGRYFKGRMVAHITPSVCQGYVRWRTEQPHGKYKDPETAPRVSVQTARRELEVLSSAVGYAYRERKLTYRVPVHLPDKAPARERWLTRPEVARLLWAAWRAPQDKSRHLARFILVALYTGTRHDAVLRLRWQPSTSGGWVDLERGIIFRRGVREAESTKRRTPVPISPRLAAHLRRWKRTGLTHVIEYKQAPVQKMRTSWHGARKLAGLGPEVVPHILRHTFATWAVQAGAPIHKVAGAMGTTADIVERVYGHHAPEHLQDVVSAVSERRENGPKTGVSARAGRNSPRRAPFDVV